MTTEERIRELEAENARLREALAEAIGYVSPSVGDMLREYTDLDGVDTETRESNRRIRETRARLEALLAAKPASVVTEVLPINPSAVIFRTEGTA